MDSQHLDTHVDQKSYGCDVNDALGEGPGYCIVSAPGASETKIAACITITFNRKKNGGGKVLTISSVWLPWRCL